MGIYGWLVHCQQRTFPVRKKFPLEYEPPTSAPCQISPLRTCVNHDFKSPPTSAFVVEYPFKFLSYPISQGPCSPLEAAPILLLQ